MDNEYLYSIIVPIYQVEDFLNRCVDSIIAQTYDKLEIILVDDGSKDGCSQICDEYLKKDNRIKVVHKKNGGLVSARQAGAKVCHGDYILCVDGDDWIENSYVEEMNKIICEYHCEMVCCNFYDAYSTGNKKRRMNYREGLYAKSDIEREILPTAIEGNRGQYFPPSMWGKAIKREIYMKEQMAVPQEITIGEDGACIKPILFEINSLYILDKCLYYYRNNNKSMTKVKKPFPWEDPVRLVEHLKNRISEEYETAVRVQCNRLLAIWAFKIAVSQFYVEESCVKIVRDIKNSFESDIYRNAIVKSEFRGVKLNCIRFIMKYRLCFCFCIFAKIL